ncbi:MAG: hypothetical protein QMD09_09165 [Desulfatibacillaceae bacterium]|nr:hypothetical protein [Desulfatibacillaceae bacterium]
MQTQHTDTLELIEKHPMTVELRKQQAAEILSTRKAAAQEIAKLERKKANALPDLVQAHKLAVAAYDEHKKKLADLEAEVGKAHVKKVNTADQFAKAISRQQAILLQTADPRIDEALEFFRSEHERIRHTKPIEQTRQDGRRNPYRDEQNLIIYTNLGARDKALTYVRAALRGLELAKLQPTFDQQEIEKLKAGIPSLEVFEEIKHTRKDRGFIPPRFGDETEFLLRRRI